MNTELHQDPLSRDVVLPDACLACGGPIAARFTDHSAQGVCLACRLITALGLERREDGVRIAHLSRGVA
ncbi:MAG TPA: hypothetical protein VLV17_04710 [Anaeromyxobacteraceae bacterium]|nr:hypothetical protein [Anaeromyxobacteraceae bacterium]